MLQFAPAQAGARQGQGFDIAGFQAQLPSDFPLPVRQQPGRGIWHVQHGRQQPGTDVAAAHVAAAVEACRQLIHGAATVMSAIAAARLARFRRACFQACICRAGRKNESTQFRRP